MVFPFKNRIRHILIPLVLFIILPANIYARDYYVTGKVTDANGNIVPGAKITMTAGTIDYASTTNTLGEYSLRISGIYDDNSGLLNVGVPFPNPFSNSVNIPFIITSKGDVRFTVYSFSGQKVMETTFGSTDAGSYQIVWDGCNQAGSPQRDGFYFYSVTFRGKTISGKLVKAKGFSSYSAGTSLVPVMLPPAVPVSSGKFRLSVITNVTCQNYYPVRLTDITIARDTLIDFDLMLKQRVPFKTSGDHIAMHTGDGYRSLVLKGINLGSSPPGYFPGEIAYAVTARMYEDWIKKMAESGFNSLRVYTLHPPVFYEKLAEYNQRHPDNPLLLFQGIWLDEVGDSGDPAEYDLINRSEAFTKDIHEVVNCINGKGDVAFRYGKAYGRYLTDVSRWTAGYIIGREIGPYEVDRTDKGHPALTSYSGTFFTIKGASATDVFTTEMLDRLVSFESQNFGVKRPVSMSSWPTLDPLTHPTETTSDDMTSFDLTRINMKEPEPGIFASYHAYPYYPNFIVQDPEYLTFSDEEGPNSYLGYLNALKAYYTGIPLVIAEFGIPSSWGSAHQSYKGLDHGGYSEQQQGEKNLRLMHNIINSGCAGGFMFAWMDEWFKPTWIVTYLEAYGLTSGSTTIPTRQIWHNLTSAEQNFGLIAFDQTNTMPFVAYQTDKAAGPLKKISATNDNSCFYLEIETNRNLNPGDTVMIAFDTYLSSVGESILPNGKRLKNRSEFLLTMTLSEDTALYNVTEAYDMNGLTVQFDLANHAVQKFRSTVTDGAAWKLMEWVNDIYMLTKQQIGKMPMENSAGFSFGQRSAVAWDGSKIKVRIPWTLLYFRDPTQMQVIDGAVSYDGGYDYVISTATSDGIGVSVYFDKEVTSTTDRYTWPLWLVAPPTTAREKKSLQVLRSGLSAIPGFTD